MKVGIYGQSNNDTTIVYVKELMTLCENYGVEMVFEKNFFNGLQNAENQRTGSTFTGYEDLPELDYFFSVGGDGTFLRSITFIREKNIPIVGINTGRLGFLATVQRDDIAGAFGKIIRKQYSVRDRSVLSLDCDDESVEFEGMQFALNEITVSRNNTASMIKIKTWLDEEFLTTYWSDGLIISTPTGSTGYSLSCGGPIISPSSQNIVLTPIAPHSLAVRPLVIPEATKIELKIDSRADDILLTLDSRIYTVKNHTKIHINKCDFTIKTLQLKDETFIKTLREKLLWGEDKRN